MRQLAAERFPEAEVRHYEAERYLDGPVHEVEVRTPGGEECELAARADGTLVYVECAIDPGELPEAVRAAVERAVPGGEIVEAERKEGPEIDRFSVEARVGERLHYLHLSPEGEVLGHSLRVPATIDVPVAR